jgi:hypothetical protein
MSKVRFGSISAAAFLLVAVAVAPAADITAKKILLKDNPDATKRQILILSKDVAATYASADTPSVGGASVHVYGSATADDFCAILEPGANWQNLGTKWKYTNATSKNGAQIKDGKILVKIKQDVPPLDYTLADDGSQSAVNVQVQFGTGTRFCMRCGGTIVKDDAPKVLAKDCAATACDPEPTSCDPPNPTTTSSTSTTSTTIGSVLKLVLAPPQTGKFNFAGVGLAGADAACATLIAGTSHCTYANLQSAETAGDLALITDQNGMTVTSFWAIDNSLSPQVQCIDDVGMGASNLNWDYQTAHTGTFASHVVLNNPAGTLGALQSGSPASNCLGSRWVGCCQ